jgi:hypothetical protein
MVGVRYRRAIFPGFSDRAEFAFSLPASVLASQAESVDGSLDQQVDFQVPRGRIATLHVSAKLLYRKADQFLLNFLFGEEAGLTAPVTVISEDETTIFVRPAG